MSFRSPAAILDLSSRRAHPDGSPNYGNSEAQKWVACQVCRWIVFNLCLLLTFSFFFLLIAWNVALKTLETWLMLWRAETKNIRTCMLWFFKNETAWAEEVFSWRKWVWFVLKMPHPPIRISLRWVYLWSYSNVVIHNATLSQKDMSQNHY